MSEMEETISRLRNSQGEESLDILRNLKVEVTKAEVWPFIQDLFKTLFPLLSDENELKRRFSWQIIYNSSVKQGNVKEFMIGAIEKDFIKEKLKSEVPKTQNVICAFIYLNIDHFIDLEVFEIITNSNCDFATLASLSMLENDEILNNFEKLSLDSKVKSLELCQDSLESQKLKLKTLLALVKRVKKQNSTLLTTFSKDQACPEETSRLLFIIAKASAEDEFRIELQKDKSLLIDAIYLLRMMHETEKSLGSLHQHSGNQEESPVQGFKCSLIRLIGNLSYQNKSNQDEVRDSNGIELILDCSPLDIRNPIITQWVVMAIRNLCKGNVDNQNVIAKMERKGKMDKEILKKSGIDIHDFE